MKINYDEQTDILYLVIRKGPAYDSEELNEDLRVEYDKKGKIVGIELLEAKRNVGKVMAQEIAKQVKSTKTMRDGSTN